MRHQKNTLLISLLILFFLIYVKVGSCEVTYPPVVGQQNLTIILVEFEDEKPEEHPSFDHIYSAIDYMSDYYWEISHNQTYFKGSVTEIFYEIGPSLDYIDVDMIIVDAIKAADEDVDFSLFRHVLVLLMSPLDSRLGFTPCIRTHPFDLV